MKRILFLCSGNYYRSRFAEAVFNWRAGQRTLPWRADSRGLALDVRNGGPVSRHTMHALAARRIPPTNCERMPQAVLISDFAAADRVIAVKEAEHRPMVERNFSAWNELVEYWHIHDLD